MMPVNEAAPVLDEAVWSAWLKKGRLQDEADDRRYKRLLGIALGLAVAGLALYMTAIR